MGAVIPYTQTGSDPDKAQREGEYMNKQDLMATGLSEGDADKILKAFIPYERFKQVNDDKKALENQIADRDKAIEELNAKIKAGEDAAKSAVYGIRKKAAIELALTKAKAKNAKAAVALLDVDKLELQEDGSIKGLDESLEALKKSDAYLFDMEKQEPSAPVAGGFNPPPEGRPQKPISYQDAVKAAIKEQLKGRVE